MIELCFPPASLINFHILLNNKCDPGKLYTELPIDDTIVSLRLRGHVPYQSLEICLKLGSEHKTIKIFTDTMNITPCKSLADVVAVVNKISEISGINFGVDEIKEIMVIHRYKIPLGSDINKFSNDGFTLKTSGVYPIIKYKYEIPGGVDHRDKYTSFRICGQNVTQTSPNEVIAHESFIRFMGKLAN